MVSESSILNFNLTFHFSYTKRNELVKGQIKNKEKTSSLMIPKYVDVNTEEKNSIC